MTRKCYPSDMTDAQWDVLKPLIPPQKSNFIVGGVARTVNMREIINGILYLNRTGCSWLQLPHDLPPVSTVKGYFYRFRNDGTWSRLTASRSTIFCPLTGSPNLCLAHRSCSSHNILAGKVTFSVCATSTAMIPVP